MSQALSAALGKFTDVCTAVPVNQFTQYQRRALDEFIQTTQALQLRSAGRGSVYQIVNMDIFTIHMRSLRPIDNAQRDSAIPKRAANIGQTRSSKIGKHDHALHYLLVKSISDEVTWQRSGEGANRTFDLSALTNIAGAGVLSLAEGDTWHSDQPLWLIENQALFDRLDWLPSKATGTVAYYAGQLPGKLLQWLANRQRAPQVILFPDYDGVGLLNYARLKQVCGEHASFWLMPDWHVCLNKFGSHEVWGNTQREFHAALSLFKTVGIEDEVAELCRTLSAEGLALEQESVWLR